MLMRTVKMAHEAESLHGIGLARPPLIKNAEALWKAWIIGRIYAVEAVVIRNVPCSSCPAASTLCKVYMQYLPVCT